MASTVARVGPNDARPGVESQTYLEKPYIDAWAVMVGVNHADVRVKGATRLNCKKDERLAVKQLNCNKIKGLNQAI